MAMLTFNPTIVRKLFLRLRSLFASPSPIPSDRDRLETTLPDEGPSITVETAFNSRCTSDWDGDPKEFHWGMFDPAKKISDQQIEKIVQAARIPRFTKGSVKIEIERNRLTFVLDNRTSGLSRDFLMVESGMQQQAIGLVCSAMGVGYVFGNLGLDGVAQSDQEYATVRIFLDAMKPSYEGTFWSTNAPQGTAPWSSGNLPDPARKGEKPLLLILKNLDTQNPGGKEATFADLSQLLWAARGRTPHYYKSEPWGLTIPTYRGEQAVTSLYVLTSTGKLSPYLNWKNGRPTHFLGHSKDVEQNLMNEAIDIFRPYNSLIILGANEKHARALWEVGYQMFNLMAQSMARDLKYKGLLADDRQKDLLRKIGIRDPIAALLVNGHF